MVSSAPSLEKLAAALVLVVVRTVVTTATMMVGPVAMIVEVAATLALEAEAEAGAVAVANPQNGSRPPKPPSLLEPLRLSVAAMLLVHGRAQRVNALRLLLSVLPVSTAWSTKILISTANAMSPNPQSVDCSQIVLPMAPAQGPALVMDVMDHDLLIVLVPALDLGQFSLALAPVDVDLDLKNVREVETL